MQRVLVLPMAILLSLASVASQDKRSDVEKTMFPDGTPPGITFKEESADDPALDAAPPNDDGKRFLQDLIDAVQASDQVVAVEHSYIHDGDDPNVHLLPERSYKRVVLTDGDRSKLVSFLGSTSPNVSPWEDACVFQPHHRLELYKGSRKLHVLEVCFTCGQLELDGVQPSEPQEIFDSLDAFLTGIGMTPEQDWASLARTGPQG